MSKTYPPPRILIALAIPLCMVLSFCITLVKEIGGAFKYAWLDAMGELDSAKRAWRR